MNEINAERRLGEILRDAPKAPAGRPAKIGSKTKPISKPPTYAESGLSKKLARRNLTPDAAALLRGRRYNRTKGKQGGDHKSKCQNDTLISTAKVLAAKHGERPCLKCLQPFQPESRHNRLCGTCKEKNDRLVPRAEGVVR
ncbi:MAG: hypothetical protein ABSE73_29015 [Planctomycetota bacterium]